MAYDPNRFINLTILLSQQLDQEQLFELILKEAMLITSCDAGTIYTMSRDETQLNFRKVITKSQKVDMGKESGSYSIPPVPLNRRFACAYAALTRQRLMIDDIYKDKRFDFAGAINYDKMTHYHTGSMMVVPMIVAGGKVTGVMQLINALNTQGYFIPFKDEFGWPVMALASVAALFVENLLLKGEL